MRKIKYKKGRKVQTKLLEYTGIHQETLAELQLFVYDSNDLTEFNDFKVSQLEKCIDVSKNNWLNLHGLNDESIIESIGDFLKVDNFMLSDVVNTTKRSKLEEYQDVIFFNIKSILPVENSDNIQVEQISFLLKKEILVSFQEKRSDFFMHVRERIRTHSGLVRDKKSDYLLYLLLDAVMENFYITLENEENRVEALINLTKTNTQLQILEKIEKHRDNFNFLKRSIIPLRDSLFSIKSMREDNVFNVIEDDTFSFFSRLHQKSIELLEQIEYDLLSLESATNFYFSTQNQKLNEVMKTLTVVSVFFMPLTFVVGVYGMNFDNMPELHWKYGYFVILACMFVLLLGMIYYFKKKKWY
ncbi:MAG TPA: magnesium/cobalt transporter CorA [Flavobacterium sp.]|uniref:magnesium/cobalt transporter CorA n=1 Tax=Flavobacterium sp. TaxID=239 RepID=UPI002BB7BC05|nr:magnesium/cobalt transporter CorA [Flavobacterium sp.]MCA0350176.1 magnesium/cobalt transporter CorA [Bacteroidota bacterium]HPW98334.1 magnesium/cobalt transporter CorA [Flavobacterium sp.]HQA74454.1 magnesium/cobalt transporter CorA [Flavobacterium sp.]